jgi:glutathione S-transferase
MLSGPVYKEKEMKWTAWTTVAALLTYFWVFANVGRARGKYKVVAPSIDGPIEFQRVYRVQINTVEQMVLFLPALWMCAYFFSDRWAAAGGIVWVIGRIVYALGYYRDPAKRELGFGISIVANVALIIGTVVGLIAR